MKIIVNGENFRLIDVRTLLKINRKSNGIQVSKRKKSTSMQNRNTTYIVIFANIVEVNWPTCKYNEPP